MTVEEIREKIISTVSRNGGHLASSLGAVELCMALASAFDPVRDRIVWDVGHQAYAWKILTGRDAEFATLRKLGGISGFPLPSESPADAGISCREERIGGDIHANVLHGGKNAGPGGTRA